MPPGALVTQAEADELVAAPNKLTMGEALPDVLALLDRRYKAKGYLDFEVIPQPTFDNAAGTVDYALAVVPGPVYRVAYVKFEGVSDVLCGHLMREWQLMPGDAFDQNYLDTFLTKAESQDALLRQSLVGVLSTVETSADPITHDVDITFRLTKS
jgi:outer membrane protein assembly factor BamA